MIEIEVRASSWPSLESCARRWKKIKDGMRLPGSMPALLGTSMHEGTGAYDLARLNGSPITADDAAGVLVDALRHPREPIVRSADDFTTQEAERIGIKLLKTYINEIAHTRKYIAVEQLCKPVPIDCGNGVVVKLTGTLDRIREDADGRLGISDVKSGARRIYQGDVDVAADGAQLGTYEIIGEATIGRPIEAPGEIIAMQTKNNGEVMAAPVERTRSILTGTPGEPGLLHVVAMYAKNDIWPANPKSALCSKKFCPDFSNCPFHN